MISLRCFAPPACVGVDANKADIESRMSIIEQQEFSVTRFKEYVNLFDSINATPIIQQAILETGHFKSALFKEGNNIFGMRFANKRPNLITGKILGHASFEHWTHSVKDYFMWRDYMIKKKCLHIDDYYKFLITVGYATDTQYTKLLKKIKI